jgi:hypothetical protein
LKPAQSRKGKKNNPAPAFRLENSQTGDIVISSSVINQFGLAGTADTFQAAVNTLLVEYFGLPNAPKPFGGRGDAFGKLNAWLVDERRPHNLLLWAPGGRGKTALLLRWIEQLPKSLDKVFVPISIRAGTNLEETFYQAMVARLAALFGETVPLSIDRFHTRERMQAYLARFTDPKKPCLVVIDGLDEATGWTITPAILPLAPPAGLRVVVSARQRLEDDGDRGWRRQLGWSEEIADSVEVLPLGQEGIADVLTRMGLGTLAQDQQIVSRLFTLTDGGEPLLVELYATDLRDPKYVERIRHTDPERLTPGLTGFFERWLTDQKVIWDGAKLPVDIDEVYTALTILAGAVGALRLVEINAVARRAGLAVGAEALSAIERFVVRSGRAKNAAEQTFVLTHPRLGEFLWKQSSFTQIYVSRADEAFLAWGAAAVAKVNASGGDPSRVPHYLLLYYSQHLRRSPAAPLESFRALAQEGWCRACSEYGGGEGSLAEQLETGLARLVSAARANPASLHTPRTGLGGMIHIGLCIASLRSLGTSVPPAIMGEMVSVGLLQPRRALFLSRARSDSERAAVIAALAPVLSDDDLPMLQSEARQVKTAEHRVKALVAVARRHLPNNGLSWLLEAVAAVAQETERSARSRALNCCVNAAKELDVEQEDVVFSVAGSLLGRENLPVRAPREAQSAETPAPSTTAEVVGQDALPPREFRPDFAPAEFIRSQSLYWYGLPDDLLEIRRRLAGISAAEATPADLNDALKLTYALEPFRKARVIKDLACFLDSDQLKDATENAVNQGGHFWLGELLLPLAVRLDPEAQCLLIERLIRDKATWGAAGKLLPVVTDQQLDRLWPSLARLTPSYEKKEVILPSVLHRLSQDQLDPLVDAAIQSDEADHMIPFYRRAEIGLIVDRLSNEQLNRLYAQTLATENADKFGYVFKEIAPKLSPDLLEEGINRTLAMEKGFYRNDRLATLLPLAVQRKPAIIENALALVKATRSGGNLLEALEPLLLHLPIERRRDVLLEQRHLALSIKDQPFVLASLAALDQMPDTNEMIGLADPSKDDVSGTVLLALLSLLPRMNAERARDAVQLVEDRFDSLDAYDRRMSTTLVALCPKLSQVKGARLCRAALELLDNPDLSESDLGRGGGPLLFSPHLPVGDAQMLIERLAAAMRHEDVKAETRLTIATILAEAPSVGNKIAFEAIGFMETAIAGPEASALSKAMLHAALQLCRRVDASLPAPDVPGVEADAERYFTDQDLARFGTLAYYSGPDFSARVVDLAERLARMERAAAMGLLALVEGSWGNTIKLCSATGGAQRVLQRVGGQHAVVETIDAIRSVAAWWP